MAVTMQARAKAKRTLKVAPATKTMICVRVGDGRQLSRHRAGSPSMAADDRRAGQDDVAAERDPGEAVFDAVLGACSDQMAGPKPMEKRVDVDAAAAGGEEVAELVDEDRAAEEDDDQEDRPDVGEGGGEEIRWASGCGKFKSYYL